MKTWYSASLGDGMTASMPSDEIRAAFQRLYADGIVPSNAAVFTRLESEGRLHCEVMAYFSPAVSGIAMEVDAQPCARPSRLGLDLLVGDDSCWSVLFD